MSMFERVVELLSDICCRPDAVALVLALTCLLMSSLCLALVLH
jgi:hypothetical protein